MTQPPKQRSFHRSNDAARTSRDAAKSQLRIIGGSLRGRQIVYSGDPVTRPMKDNIREAVFNLIGAWVPGKLAIDLFAGTGAIGIEALSRGAEFAIFVERHFPTARLIQQNLTSLELLDRAELETSDTFFWARQYCKAPKSNPRPWAMFCSPPYDLYATQPEAMTNLIRSLVAVAPPHSVMVVESDHRFDATQLPDFDRWRVREYSPARLHILRPSASEDLPAD